MTPEEILDLIEKCDTEAAVSAAKDLVSAGEDPEAVYTETSEEAIHRVERKFTLGGIGLAPMMGIVRTALAVRDALGIDPRLGKAVVCTVDSHVNGRSLMALLLQVAGFDVNEVSKDFVAEDIAELCKDPEVTVCTASSAFATTEWKLKAINQALTEAGVRERIVFNVGGSAVSEHMCRKVGADLYAENAADTVKLVVDRVRAMRAGLVTADRT